MTKQQDYMKRHAIELMRELGLCPDIIGKFHVFGRITMFSEGYAGLVRKDSDIMQRITAFEKRSGCLVYAVCRDRFRSFGCDFDSLSLLFVSKYEEDWAHDISGSGNTHRVFAYVHNLDDEDLSEMGSIALKVSMAAYAVSDKVVRYEETAIQLSRAYKVYLQGLCALSAVSRL